VEDLMHTALAIPLVQEDTLMKEALFVITAKALGVTGVCSSDGALKGVITDGDLRRSLEKGHDILNLRADEIMKHNPLRIKRGELAAAALQIMEHRAITSLFVFENDQSASPCGIIHLHDILKAGIA
jgi:arabinose-5-phosphate isomerase